MTAHEEYPEPYILFQAVRDEGGQVLDYHWTDCNLAAAPWVSGLPRRVSAWREVEGLPGLDVLRGLVRGGEPLALELRLSAETWFRAWAVRRGDGFELWLWGWSEARRKQRVLLQTLEREHRELERARGHEAHLALALDAARMVTWEWSEERETLALSANAEAFFGQTSGGLDASVEWLLGQARPEERAGIVEAITRMRSSEGTHSFTFHGTWPDGSLHAYEIVGRSLREEGQSLRVLGVAMDRTERLGAEEAVREAEERYRLAALATNDVLWEWIPSTGEISWGEASQQAFGYLPQEMGDYAWWVAQIHPEDRDRASSSLQQVVDGGGEAWSTEYRFRSKDGAYVDVLDRGRVARNARGEARRVIGSMMDITERKAALERMREEGRFRERFIGILGHDLRTPLNAISLLARDLRRGGLPVLQQKSVQRIETSAARMGNMIADILDLTRARLSGNIPLDLSPTSLSLVCQQVVDELMTIYPERRVSLRLDGACEGIWDGPRLVQVVSNLVGNALEHTPLGSAVRLECREDGAGWRVVEITNDGSPIPAHLLETLFDPFRQAGPARTGRGSGLGLGLYIVHQLVLAHQGEVSVRSTRDEGTRFSVRLPRDSRGPLPPVAGELPAPGNLPLHASRPAGRPK